MKESILGTKIMDDVCFNYHKVSFYQTEEACLCKPFNEKPKDYQEAIKEICMYIYKLDKNAYARKPVYGWTRDDRQKAWFKSYLATRKEMMDVLESEGIRIVVRKLPSR